MEDAQLLAREMTQATVSMAVAQAALALSDEQTAAMEPGQCRVAELVNMLMECLDAASQRQHTATAAVS